MKIEFSVISLFFCVSVMELICLGNALKCWKCIAHDCNANLEENYTAAKVKCQEDQMCMKVRYRMFDNLTHYDSVIRTCTDTRCNMPSLDEFNSCVHNPAKYMIGGCTLRSCCDDRDLCNSCEKSEQISNFVIFTIFLIYPIIQYWNT